MAQQNGVPRQITYCHYHQKLGVDYQVTISGHTPLVDVQKVAFARSREECEYPSAI
jgi:hypothetical protein